MQFCDRLTIDRSHRSRDGYLRVTAKAARTGVQDYLGREVDPEGKHFAADQVVKVYRPPEEVFAADSVASFIGRPITDDHPAVPVTAKNWRELSRGVIGGAVKDGEWLRFDLALMDADTVAKVARSAANRSAFIGNLVKRKNAATIRGLRPRGNAPGCFVKGLRDSAHAR